MDQTFRAIIEVVNRASAPLRQIETGFASLMVPITGVRLAVGSIGREVGVDRLAASAVRATEKVRHLGRELGALVGPVAVIGGIASVEGLFEASKKSAEFGEALGHSSEKTGVDIPALARMHYVAKLEDVDPEAFDKALAKLNSNLFKALHGKNKDFSAMMTRFEGGNWAKKIKGPEDALAAISEAYRKHTSVVTRAGIVTTAFGDRMGVGMKPILGKTREELKALGDEFEHLYGRWTPERVEQAKEAADNWKRLTLAGQGLGTMIGGAVTPAIMDLVVPLREWIANNKELIAQKVQNTIREIGDSFKTADWKGVAAGISMVWSGFKGVIGLLGAKGTVIAAAALLFGPILVAALGAAKALVVLAADVLLVTGRLGILLGVQAFKFFADLVTGIRLAIPAFAALDLALSANPIGAAVLAVGALAAIAYVVYDHWRPIADFFRGLWASIKAAWQPAKEWFSDLWSGIVGGFMEIYAKIKPVIDAIKDFWRREDARKSGNGGHRSLAERHIAERSSPAARAAAAANKAALRRNLARAVSVIGIMAVPTPIVAMAQGVQAIHDKGKQERVARERLERQALSNGALGRAPSAGSGPDAGKVPNGKVDVTVNLNGLPRGSQAQAESSGTGLNLKVGKSFQN